MLRFVYWGDVTTPYDDDAVSRLLFNEVLESGYLPWCILWREIVAYSLAVALRLMRHRSTIPLQCQNTNANDTLSIDQSGVSPNNIKTKS